MESDLIRRGYMLATLRLSGIDTKGKDSTLIEASEFVRVLKEAPAVDAEPTRHGCRYCSGEFVECQHSIHTKVYMNTTGKAQALVTECSPCPPYANCSMRDVPARSAFIINFCPFCGRKLNSEVEV